MSKPPTVYDVAAQAGVSIATVSRYFRSPESVREETRARVRVAVHDLGYVPSGSARGLAARRTGTIGICFPSFDEVEEFDPVGITERAPVTIRVDSEPLADTGSDLYLSEVIRGAELEAWRHGLAVTIAVPRGHRRHEVIDNLAGRVDGLIALARAVPDEQLAHIARRIPVVLMAGPRSGDSYDHVSSDNRSGMTALISHLVTDHRFRALRFVGGPPDSPDSQDRFDGFRDALGRAGITAPEHPFVHGDFTRVGGREVGHRLLSEGLAGIDALVCANDQTALGVLDVLLAAGVRVPDDIALTGFDGIEGSALTIPRLTTVRQPMLELGRVAVVQLLQRLANPTGQPVSRIRPVEVLLRDSCGTHDIATMSEPTDQKR